MVTPTHLNDIQQTSDLGLSLYDLYKNKECCDVTICTTDPQSYEQIYFIECHKVVLVASSQYFRDVLLHGGDSSSLNFADTGQGREDTVTEVLSFLYTGKCQVSSANIVELLRYSLDWKLKNLERLITELIAKYLTVDNVLEMYELAVREGNTHLEKDSSTFMRKNFVEFSSTEQFKGISITTLSTILKEDEIKVDSEDSIMKAVLMWLEINPQATSGINDLWNVIRFQHLTANYLMNELLDHPLMQEEPQKDLVRKAAANLYEYGQAFTYGGVPRYWGVKPVYDKLAKVTISKKICVYDDEKKEWEQVGEVPDWVDSSTQQCITGSTAIFLGTLKKDSHAGKCASVDLKRMLIKSSLPESNNALVYTGVAQVGNSVYNIGGKSLCGIIKSNEVKKLNLENYINKWEANNYLPKAVDSPLVFAYKQHIYVIGGYLRNDEKDEECSVNQMYDTEQSKWSLRTPAMQPCNSYYNGGFIHKNFTTTHHMTYTIDTNTWTCTEYITIGEYVQPVLHGDQILAYVTPSYFDGDCLCKTYNEETNQWSDSDINVEDCMGHHLLFTYKL